MTDFSYKTLSGEHAEAWHTLRVDGARCFPLAFLRTAEEMAAMTIDQCRKMLAAGQMYGVFDGEKLIGFCGFRPERLEQTRHRAEVGPLYVSPDYHGTGAADSLMTNIIDQARELGLAQVELYVNADNPRACGFYEKHGFTTVAKLFDFARVDDVPQHDLLMVLRLLAAA